MTHYQGHLPDGSSIQRHSAGGLYPYIVYAQQKGDALRWGYIAPDGARRLTSDSYSDACDAALAHKDSAARAKAFKAGREYCLLACHFEIPERIVHRNAHWYDRRDEGNYTYADTERQRRLSDAIRHH